MKKTKRQLLGQHFLKSPAIIHKICEETVHLVSEQTAAKSVLEIGPGRGALTHPLLERLQQSELRHLQSFQLSEMDEKLIEYWKRELDGVSQPRIKLLPVLCGDFLQLPPQAWLPSTGKLVVVSNLPYASGTAIVNRLAEFPETIAGMVLMFQAEVAERLRARPGTKAWGSLSIWIQNHWEVHTLVRVPPHAFEPPPRVQSEVVVLKPRATPVLPAIDPALLEKTLKVFFQHRRKMLRRALPPEGPWRKALQAAQIAETLRAEDLTWEDWNRILTLL